MYLAVRGVLALVRAGRALRRLEFDQPKFQLGCGDGAFTALLGVHVEEGIDLNPRAIERAGERRDVYKRLRCFYIVL